VQPSILTNTGAAGGSSGGARAASSGLAVALATGVAAPLLPFVTLFVEHCCAWIASFTSWNFSMNYWGKVVSIIIGELMTSLRSSER
jgi:hypothetical protein